MGRIYIYVTYGEGVRRGLPEGQLSRRSLAFLLPPFMRVQSKVRVRVDRGYLFAPYVHVHTCARRAGGVTSNGRGGQRVVTLSLVGNQGSVVLHSSP